MALTDGSTGATRQEATCEPWCREGVGGRDLPWPKPNQTLKPQLHAEGLTNQHFWLEFYNRDAEIAHAFWWGSIKQPETSIIGKRSSATQQLLALA